MNALREKIRFKHLNIAYQTTNCFQGLLFLFKTRFVV